MKRSRFQLLALIVVFAGLAVVLTACADKRTPDFPIFPNTAQNIVYAPDDTHQSIARTVTFDTSDSPQSVKDFYQTALTHAGWERDT